MAADPGMQPTRIARGLAAGVAMMAMTMAAAPTRAAVVLPVSWTAGGASAGNDGVGNSSGIAVDASGNIAIVSGPAFGRDLGVTSYDTSGGLRWQITLRPAAGTYGSLFNQIVAAPDGDFVVVGEYSGSQGRPTQITLARLANDGTLRWRIDPSLSLRGFGRLVVDDQGNAYLPFLSTLHKYSPTGALLWEQATGTLDYATALSPDHNQIVVTGATGGMWRTTAFDTATGAQSWMVVAAEGIAATGVAIDATIVYVVGQGRVGTRGVLSVVAYDRGTGARLWRTDSAPAGTDPTAGLRVALAPSGGVVVAGTGLGDRYWWNAAIDGSGTIRWEASRDLATNREEPADIFVLPDGTTVVTGASGPEIQDGMGNTYLRGVTVGYSSTGTLLWEAFSTLPTRAALLQNGDVCATGGYDALVTCFGVAAANPTAVIAAMPITGTAPLTVDFSAQGSTPASAPLASWEWTFGDGDTASGVEVAHVYSTAGSYDVRLEVTDTLGAIGSAFLTIGVTAPPAPDDDGDGFTAPADCDDTDPAVNPGAEETCDGIDNDCDDVVDPDLSQPCCGSGVSRCTAGVWGACSVSCADGGVSDTGGPTGGAPELRTGCSCGTSASDYDSPGSLLAMFSVVLLVRLRRRR